MEKWLTFFKERTPLVSYVLITMGPAMAGYFLAKEKSLFPMLLSFLGFFLFFLVLRMMDEFKDYEKDVLAHPRRPLPRGLIPLPEFKAGITIGIFALLVFNVYLVFTGYPYSAIFYAAIIIHLRLMYKEFYVAEWINARPILYAITHQLILVTICLFALSTYRVHDQTPFDVRDWVYALSVLFSFFSYEVCRKLDPKAHPVLKTYLSIYEMKGVIKIVGTLAILHIIALAVLFKTDYHQIFFDLPIILLMSGLFALNSGKLKFKKVELLATLNLLIFLYSGIYYATIN